MPSTPKKIKSRYTVSIQQTRTFTLDIEVEAHDLEEAERTVRDLPQARLNTRYLTEAEATWGPVKVRFVTLSRAHSPSKGLERFSRNRA